MAVFRCEANFEYYCIAQYKPTFFHTGTCCFIFLFHLHIFMSRLMRFGCTRPLPTVESRGRFIILVLRFQKPTLTAPYLPLHWIDKESCLDDVPVIWRSVLSGPFVVDSRTRNQNESGNSITKLGYRRSIRRSWLFSSSLLLVSSPRLF
jgi:hypothetical protein